MQGKITTFLLVMKRNLAQVIKSAKKFWHPLLQNFFQMASPRPLLAKKNYWMYDKTTKMSFNSRQKCNKSCPRYWCRCQHQSCSVGVDTIKSWCRTSLRPYPMQILKIHQKNDMPKWPKILTVFQLVCLLVFFKGYHFHYLIEILF